MYFVKYELRLTEQLSLSGGADKSLARPGRKQSNVSVRMTWISFGARPCGGWGESRWQLVSRCCWNRARPWHASELVSFLVGLTTYQHRRRVTTVPSAWAHTLQNTRSPSIIKKNHTNCASFFSQNVCYFCTILSKPKISRLPFQRDPSCSTRKDRQTKHDETVAFRRLESASNSVQNRHQNNVPFQSM